MSNARGVVPTAPLFAWRNAVLTLLRLGVLGAMFACGTSLAAQLPLASVRYFNAYQHPTNWGGWGSAVYVGGGASVRNVNGTLPVDYADGVPAIVLDSVNPPGGWWNVGFKVSGNQLNFLRVGTNPAIHLKLKWGAIPTNGAWNISVLVEGASVTLSNYLTASTNSWQDVYIPVSALKASKPSVDLTRVWGITVSPVKSYRDHCLLRIAALDLVPSATSLDYTEFIKLDQVGYSPNMASKLVLVSWESGTLAQPPKTFQLVNVTNNQVVFTGPLTLFVRNPSRPDWAADGDEVCQGDFGPWRTPGVYQVEVPELAARSAPFAVATNAYHQLVRDSLRFFYYSRSGEAITEPFAEGYTRGALHTETTHAAYNYDPHFGHFNFGTNLTRDVHGCWFDAGDTHIDVVGTATACWFLLETLRDFGGSAAASRLNLPESDPRTNDLVPLVSTALEWLKRMQNPDGSVHHYVMGDPDTASQPQRVSDISSFAAAAAAGTFAKAYAQLRPSLAPEQAADLLARARLSWSWLLLNTNMVQPRLALQNGKDPGADDTNPYWGDLPTDQRYRAYAAIELFEATGEAVFNDYFLTQFRRNGGTPLDGPLFGFNKTGYETDQVITYLSRMFNFGLMDYARSSQAVDKGVQALLRNTFIHQANILTNYTGLSGYHIPLLYPGHLYWGSNGGVLAPSAMVLRRAFEWTGDRSYHEAAMQALHFICGANPVNRVFVSGYGDYLHGSDFYSHFWTNLLHQPPGYLGGNIDVDGSAAPVVEHPWKRFINTQDADMTEPGVYWNAAFAWLAGYADRDASAPTLDLKSTTGSVQLTWPLSSTDYALDSTTNLDPPVSWSSLPQNGTLSSGFWRRTLPISSESNQFFRLRAP